MGPSMTRYLPGLGSQIEPRVRGTKEGASSPKEGGTSSCEFTGNIYAVESLSDEAILTLICKGDTEAFAWLFRRYAQIVRRVALRVLKDASEADDLLQDIFILIRRQCGTFDSSKGSAQVWILQIAYRRAISRRRYLNSRHFYTRVELDDRAIHDLEPRFGECDAANRKLLAGLDLQKVFATLSEDQQQTLRLHFVEGYTLDEIAKMLGQTKGNVRHHSFRGLERLRKLIFAGKLPGPRAV